MDSDGKPIPHEACDISAVEILNLQRFTISHHIVREKQISIPVNMLPAGLYIVKAGLMTKTITVQ